MRLAHTLLRAARHHGSRPAVIDGNMRLDWRAFVDRVSRMAGVLHARGIAVDEPVALLAHNSHRFLTLQFAAPWAGPIFMPLNVRLSVEELAGMINASGTRALFFDGEFASMASDLRSRCPRLAQLIPMSLGANDETHYRDLLAQSTPMAPLARGGDDIAFLYYTGGTTGTPKGVMLTHANVLSNAMNLVGAAGLDERLVHLHAAPLFHVAGSARTIAVSLVAGTHVVLPKFSAREVLVAIQEHRVTMMGLVPAMASSLHDALASGPFDTSSLAKIAYGAAPMPESTLRRLLAALPRVDFYQLYGQTELSPMATILMPCNHQGPDARLLSAGRPVLNAEIKIVDEEGTEVASGMSGEIAVRGPMVMKGYWRDPQLTARVLHDGWMHTGDIGYLDADGFLYVVDRKNDMIISGGENIYSIEVENVLLSHPAVVECAVFGIPNVRWGESVHAVVVCKQAAVVTQDELIAHCHNRIAAYKCPKTVDFRNAPLPLSGANKVLKSLLREPYWRSMERQVN